MVDDEMHIKFTTENLFPSIIGKPHTTFEHYGIYTFFNERIFR